MIKECLIKEILNTRLCVKTFEIALLYNGRNLGLASYMQVRRNNILNGIWNDFMNEVKNNEQGTSLPRKPSAKWYSYLGPGFIMAAIVFGPGSLTIASRLGAGYGYSLLWIIVIATFFMVIFVDMAIRIGLATKSSFISTIITNRGKRVSVL